MTHDYDALVEELKEKTAELSDLQKSFDIRWDADMRGIEKWRVAGEGRELTWPDHADLVCFLIEQSDAQAAEIERLKKQVETLRGHIYDLCDVSKFGISLGSISEEDLEQIVKQEIEE